MLPVNPPETMRTGKTLSRTLKGLSNETLRATGDAVTFPEESQLADLTLGAEETRSVHKVAVKHYEENLRVYKDLYFPPVPPRKN